MLTQWVVKINDLVTNGLAKIDAKTRNVIQRFDKLQSSIRLWASSEADLEYPLDSGEKYDEYWKLTVEYTDIFGAQFNNTLKVIVKYIDDNIDKISV